MSTLGWAILIGALAFAACCALCGWTGWRAGTEDSRDTIRELRAMARMWQNRAEAAEEGPRVFSWPSRPAEFTAPQAAPEPSPDTDLLPELTDTGWTRALAIETNAYIARMREEGDAHRKELTAS